MMSNNNYPSQLASSTNYNPTHLQPTFISPIRGTSAAVPTRSMNINATASPYQNKKRTERITKQGGQQQVREYSEEDFKKMMSYGQINLEDASRLYSEILDQEKKQFKKKEVASKEIICEISKKLKVFSYYLLNLQQTEKRINEESKMTIEYKKRHDQLKKKLDKSQKEKIENVTQLKSLFVLFTQQRKALEVSIQKGKKLEEDNTLLTQRNKNLEEQHKMFYNRIEQLEADSKTLIYKHKRDKEQLEQEIEEKRTVVKKYEQEFKDITQQKLMMKKQIDEYELKIKRLIIEFEEESKKHIRDLHEVHEQYRVYKSNALDLDQRIQQYKSDSHKALQSERDAKKEAHRLRLQSDELVERLRFMDQRYSSLIQRMGATQEDLQAIDEMLINANMLLPQQHNAQHYQDLKVEDFDQEEGSQKRSKKGDLRRPDPVQQQPAYLYNFQQQNQKPLLIQDHLNDSSGEDDDNADYQEEAQVDVYQQKQVLKGVISGEQTIESNNNSKENQQVMRKIGQGVGEEKRLYEKKRGQGQVQEEEEEESEADDLLKKLIENIDGNPALQNKYIKEQFKLEKIKNETDLHDYKNLLNSMAALFYTNHKLNDVTVLFYMWREATLAKQKELVLQKQINQSQSSGKKSQKSKLQAPAAIQIDTALANKQPFKNYSQNQQPLITDGSPSEIAQVQQDGNNRMLHIEGSDEDSHLFKRSKEEDDPDKIRDKQNRNFIEELKQVGPFSKQILNYTYPPLLYQRGDDDYGDEEYDAHCLQKLQQDFDYDEDIQALIKGEGGAVLDNEDLYAKLQNIAKNKEAQHYREQVDKDGHVYLVDAEHSQLEDAEYGQENYMDDEEFMKLMGHEEVHDRQIISDNFIDEDQ